MATTPSVLLITTQTWLQITRMALRLIEYGAELSTISPEESHLTVLSQVRMAYRFQVHDPLGSLRRAIQKSHADFLLPTDDMSVLMLHDLWEASSELRPLIERSLGDSNFYWLLRSRPHVLDLAESLGIQTPATRIVQGKQDLERWEHEHGMPAVLKRDCTWGGNGVRIAQNSAEMQRAYSSLRQDESRVARTLRWLRSGDGTAFARLRSAGQSQITVQEFIEGTPANAMFACLHGRVLASVQTSVIASIGSTGPSLIVRALHDPRISAAGTLMAKALGISGFFGLDFILERHSGTPYLLELNPRSTRLGHLGMSGGSELAGAMWQAWTGLHAARAGVLHHGEALAFYPDGQRLLGPDNAKADCLVDVVPEEAREIDAVLVAYARKQSRLRRRAWAYFAKRKKQMLGETETSPFFHEPLGAANTADTALAAS